MSSSQGHIASMSHSFKPIYIRAIEESHQGGNFTVCLLYKEVLMTRSNVGYWFLCIKTVYLLSCHAKVIEQLYSRISSFLSDAKIHLVSDL